MKIETATFGEVEILDFTALNHDIKINILEMRNHPKVREQMHSQDIIDENDHLRFIDSLIGNDNKKYFAVKYKQSLLGVIYFTNINNKNRSAVFGIYTNLREKVDKMGSILMESALAYFNNILSFKTLSLEVYESNQRAVGLYLKFRFVMNDCFYQDGHKVLTMTWVEDNL